MRELLVIQTAVLGDIVHGLQAVAALRAQQPDWRVTWVARDVFAPLVRASEEVDEVLVLRGTGGWRGMVSLFREVQRREFDAVWDLRGTLRSAFVTKAARAHRKLGRDLPNPGAGFFYREKIAPLGPHLLQRALAFVQAMGAEPKLAGPLRFRDYANLSLAGVETASDLRPVLIFPESRWPERRWHGFAELTSLLVREGGRKVIWVGHAYQPCREAFTEGRFLNLTGNTSLASLSALILRSDWVVTNDSGPMHLAAALGAKTLAVFGPTDPQRHGPWPALAPTNHVMPAPLGDLLHLSAREVFTRWRKLDAFARGASWESAPPFGR